jgi:hypothetical protein
MTRRATKTTVVPGHFEKCRNAAYIFEPKDLHKVVMSSLGPHHVRRHRALATITANSVNIGGPKRARMPVPFSLGAERSEVPGAIDCLC